MIKSITITDLVNGNINSSGNLINQSNRLRSDFIMPVGSEFRSATVSWEAASGYSLQAAITCVGTSGSVSKDYYWLSSGSTVDMTGEDVKKFVLVFRRTDNRDLSPEAVVSATIVIDCKDYSWYIGEDGYPTNVLFPELPASPMEKPYPKALWRIDPRINGGYPYHELMPGLVRKGPGAFYNAVKLTRVRIPETVKLIGEEAFANTALRSVTIAPDCQYSETSFPEGCEVNYYGGGGEYGQLLDCNGVEILDGEAVRIYVKGE